VSVNDELSKAREEVACHNKQFLKLFQRLTINHGKFYPKFMVLRYRTEADTVRRTSSVASYSAVQYVL
jgi:hypothetical protein